MAESATTTDLKIPVARPRMAAFEPLPKSASSESFLLSYRRGVGRASSRGQRYVQFGSTYAVATVFLNRFGS